MGSTASEIADCKGTCILLFAALARIRTCRLACSGVDLGVFKVVAEDLPGAENAAVGDC